MQQGTSIVRILVKAKDGKILLLRRSAFNKRSVHKFELPGGKVDQNEPFLQAALRELVEETGIVPQHDPILILTLEEDWEKGQYSTRCYMVEVPHELPIILSQEHDESRWIKNKELQQITLTESAQLCMQKMIEEVKKNTKSTNDVKKSIFYEELLIYSDGGSRGNPGPSASGYVIMTPEEKILEEGGEYLGITTNNQAEYQAVKLALEKAAKYHAQKIIFRIDSELVVKQMNGEFQIRNRDLWPVHAHIKELVALYKKVSFVHVRREFNQLADNKVNEILDSRKGALQA